MPYTTRSKILARSNQPVPDTPQARADQEHQDPRIVAGTIGEEGKKVQAVNWGQFKNKAAARNDKPINWFRRGAKPASK